MAYVQTFTIRKVTNTNGERVKPLQLARYEPTLHIPFGDYTYYNTLTRENFALTREELESGFTAVEGCTMGETGRYQSLYTTN